MLRVFYTAIFWKNLVSHNKSDTRGHDPFNADLSVKFNTFIFVIYKWLMQYIYLIVCSLWFISRGKTTVYSISIRFH